ncbi:MAG: hypothetical protein R6U55_06665, partial [Desulfovermiculus sp.]
MQRAAQSDTQDHNHARFLRILQRDERDLDGRLLKAGTKVLFNPIQPEAIREDTPDELDVEQPDRVERA